MSRRRPLAILSAGLLLALVWYAADQLLAGGREVTLRSDEALVVRLPDGREVETNRWYLRDEVLAPEDSFVLWDHPFDPAHARLTTRLAMAELDGADTRFAVSVRGEVLVGGWELGPRLELDVRAGVSPDTVLHTSGSKLGRVDEVGAVPFTIDYAEPDAVPWAELELYLRAFANGWAEGDAPLHVNGVVVSFPQAGHETMLPRGSGEPRHDHFEDPAEVWASFEEVHLDLDQAVDLDAALAPTAGGMAVLSIGSGCSAHDFLELVRALDRLDVPYMMRSRDLPDGRVVSVESVLASDVFEEPEEEPLEADEPDPMEAELDRAPLAPTDR